MKRTDLGGTGISVSRLCFGALTIGPLQANLTIDNGAKMIAMAIEKGVNFVDTAELYQTLPMIEKAMVLTGQKDLVVATKSYAHDHQTAEQSLKKALKELKRDYVDVFMLHEQESIHTLRGHWEALEYFLKQKEAGYIRALGLSTHHIAGVRAANRYPEIEVIHPIINRQGLGIQDGSVDDMIQALKEAKAMGKGIYGMKPFGGGNLLKEAEHCLKWAMDQDYLDAVAVGMQYPEEVEANVYFFENGVFPHHTEGKLKNKTRKLMIHDWCIGCGACVEVCPTKAMSIKEGKAVVDSKACVLCGYCSAYCKEFCIKVI